MKNVLLLFSMVVLSVGFLMPQVGLAQETAGFDYTNKESSSAGFGSNDDETAGFDRNITKDTAALNNPLDSSISTIPAFFIAVINILMIFAIPFIVLFIIYAGFLYVSARGNAETIKKAHAALLYALIGGLLILGSRTLLTIISNTAAQITSEQTN